MNKSLLLLAISGLLLITSCLNSTVMESDYSGLEQESAMRYHYDGTIYDYLKENDIHPEGMTFDSLLFLLDYEDALFASQKACLTDPDGNYTLLAVPDDGFYWAMKSLRTYRNANALNTLEGELTLQKLLESRNRIVRTNPDSTELNPLPADTLYVEYKNDLDSLVSRYIFVGEFDTEILMKDHKSEKFLVKQCIRYGYRMAFSVDRLGASGFVEGGLKDFSFYDINNTLQENKWDVSKVKWMDIYATNGVIHIMNPGHEFGFAEFVQRFKNYGHEK